MVYQQSFWKIDILPALQTLVIQIRSYSPLLGSSRRDVPPERLYFQYFSDKDYKLAIAWGRVKGEGGVPSGDKGQGARKACFLLFPFPFPP